MRTGPTTPPTDTHQTRPARTPSMRPAKSCRHQGILVSGARPSHQRRGRGGITKNRHLRGDRRPTRGDGEPRRPLAFSSRLPRVRARGASRHRGEAAATRPSLQSRRGQAERVDRRGRIVVRPAPPNERTPVSPPATGEVFFGRSAAQPCRPTPPSAQRRFERHLSLPRREREATSHDNQR